MGWRLSGSTAAVLATTAALALVMPPLAAARALRLLATAPQSTFDSVGPGGAAAALCAGGAWALVGWLVVVTGLAGLSRASSARVPRALLRILLPDVAGRLLGGVLGLTLVALPAGTATAGSPAATAGSPAATAEGAVPETAPRAGIADLDWPTSDERRRDVVTVRPGDTLWDLAATSLAAGRPAGTGPPSTAVIAASWPRWWAVNRGEIGADPDLIQPGQHLVPPSPRTSP